MPSESIDLESGRPVRDCAHSSEHLDSSPLESGLLAVEEFAGLGLELGSVRMQCRHTMPGEVEALGRLSQARKREPIAAAFVVEFGSMS